MVRQLKEAKTYQEQIENLINNHALQISDRTKAEEILSTVNYYRLSAYGIGLMQPADPEKYLPGITLEHIYHLYQFDSGLRNILTPLIEYVEITFRTRLAYQLAIMYGAEGYRDASHFSRKTDRNRNSIYQKTIDQLDKEIEHQQSLPCVKHHMTVYGGHFPIWAAMELIANAESKIEDTLIAFNSSTCYLSDATASLAQQLSETRSSIDRLSFAFQEDLQKLQENLKK